MLRMHPGAALAGALLCALLIGAGHADAEILNFTATIDGAQANNCAGTGSPGTGMGTFVLDTTTMQVDYNITFSGLMGTETAAHVHQEAALCTGGGIVYGLPLGSPKVGSAILTAPQMAAMIDGLHYVNIHSTVQPGGEIRGQIVQDNAIPASSTTSMIVLVIATLAAGTLMLGWRARRTSQPLR